MDTGTLFLLLGGLLFSYMLLQLNGLFKKRKKLTKNLRHQWNDT